MGKAKNQRHRMVGASAGFAQGAPARTLLNLGNSGVDLSGLEANLSSIHENKRVQACQLISDICKLNGHSSKVMDKVSNKKILSKFNLLLVDHSLRVKHAAFVTLQILSSIGSSDVVGRLVSSGIFRTALTVATDTTDFSSSAELLDIKQNALYSVANVISSQPASVQEVIQHNVHFFDFLLNSTSADGNISILNTCLNVLNILSRSAKHDQLINVVLGQRAISVVQQLMNTLLQEKMSIDASTNTVLLTVQAISTADQDVWIVIIQCLEILSNFYINAVSSVEVQQAIDARNVANIAVQLLALAANGISAVEGSVSRENDFVEMLSEFFSNLCTKVSGYIQGLEDGNGKLREPSDRSLHIRYMYMGSLLSTTRTPTSDSVSAFLAVLQHLQIKLQDRMMTAEAYSQYQASQQMAGADEEETMLADDADPDMAVTNPTTAGVAARTMSRNLMGASYVLSHEALNTVLVMEKAQSALGDLLALQTSLVMIPSELPPLPSSGFVQWDTFFAQAKFLQDALHNTTPSMDEASRKATEGWMTAEEEDLMPLKSSIITQCVTFFDIMTALISHSAASLPTEQCVWVITEEQLRSLVVLLLQWLSTPQLEICLSVLATISSFAKEQWCGSSTFPVALFGVVTNALINRLRQPTAYSTSSTRDSSTGTQVTLNKSQNVQRATILLLDAVFNAVIDMNSNDHLTYHQTFVRMNIATIFAQEHEQLMQRVQSNIFLLSESERDQLEDTLANIEGLLEYKRTNFR